MYNSSKTISPTMKLGEEEGEEEEVTVSWDLVMSTSDHEIIRTVVTVYRVPFDTTVQGQSKSRTPIFFTELLSAVNTFFLRVDLYS